ncbi:proton-coupled folate transporter-like isoform X2 [Dreissena polymorpha]|uniref:Solute carrier family 46 member 3 n=1 Tax=Dreissena polymorpha TaxID=45954 RepID=A0A9D4LAN5_DREPO|nr:proton-coupled folate transporter-like isoform X2 [Dreissena polymorpha]KAH3854560.1 hypothetical protein DPMN_097103 [Dreissena polymorpha]
MNMTDLKRTITGSIQEKETVSVAVTSWRRFLIGPVVGLYMTGYMLSYFTIIEYTNATWREKKFREANLTNVNATSSDSLCDVNATDPAYKVQDEATSMASKYLVYFSTAQGAPAIISNIILGSYSDALGRKFLLFVGVSGTGLRLIISTFIINYNVNLLFFICACLVEGCTGQFTTVTQACFAYIGDVTVISSGRTYGMAYIMINLALSLIASSYIAGFLIQHYGFLVPIATAAGLLVITLMVVVLFLPESFPSEKRTRERDLRTMLKNSLSFVVSKTRDRWKYQLIFAAHAFSEFGFIGRLGVETLYMMAHPFCWTSQEVGHYTALRTLAVMVFGMGLVRLYKMLLSDVGIAMFGVASYATCFFMEALANNNSLLYIALAANSFTGLESVMIRSIASTLTDASRQGALFSAFAAVDVTINLLSDIATGTLYSLTVGILRGFVFIVLGGVQVIAFLLLLTLLIGWHRERRLQSTEKI